MTPVTKHDRKQKWKCNNSVYARICFLIFSNPENNEIKTLVSNNELDYTLKYRKRQKGVDKKVAVFLCQGV